MAIRMNNPKLLSAIQNADSFLLVTHISPDGDAIGSLLAAGSLLRKMGKRVVLACADAVPSRFSFLPGASEILTPDRIPQESYRLALAIDTADIGRMGTLADIFQRTPVTAQIDHHGTNPLYAQYNEVNSNAAAAGELVLALSEAFGLSMNQDDARCLYAAIASDTGNFCFNNVTEHTFDCMKTLMHAGLDISESARRCFLTRQKEHMLLLSCALRSIRFFADGRATGMVITKENYLYANAGHEHADRIVNYGLEIEGVSMTYLAEENENGFRFSLRALPPFDVAVIAAKFGGGGHKLAAGCRIEASLADASALIENEFNGQLCK